MLAKPSILTQCRLVVLLVTSILLATACKTETSTQTSSNQSSAQPTPTPAPTATPAPTTLQTASGLTITDIQWGKGPAPAPGARVQLRYRLTDAAGTIVDSTDGLPQPVEVRWDDPGAGTFGVWRDLLQSLPAGSKAKAHIPAAKAFGERGYREVVAPNTDLVLEWEVVGFADPDPAAPGTQ